MASYVNSARDQFGGFGSSPQTATLPFTIAAADGAIIKADFFLGTSLSLLTLRDEQGNAYNKVTINSTTVWFWKDSFSADQTSFNWEWTGGGDEGLGYTVGVLSHSSALTYVTNFIAADGSYTTNPSATITTTDDGLIAFGLIVNDGTRTLTAAGTGSGITVVPPATGAAYHNVYSVGLGTTNNPTIGATMNSAGSWSISGLVFSEGSGGGAIVGSMSGAFALSGTLRGTGALAGTVSVAMTLSGLLRGTGALAGSMSQVLSLTGLLRGAGALASTQGMQIGLTGLLRGTGALASAQAATFTLSGLLRGAGALASPMPTQMSLTGSFSSTSTIAGAMSQSIVLSGALTGTGALSGSLAAALNLTGTLTSLGSGAMTGALSAVLAMTGQLSGTGVIASAMAASFSLTGLMSGAGALVGVISQTFSMSGLLRGSGALASIQATVINLAGTLMDFTPGAATGSAAMQWSLLGSLSNLTPVDVIPSGNRTVRVSMGSRTITATQGRRVVVH